MEILNAFLRHFLNADIIEEIPNENGSVTYLGYFEKMTDENDENNCMVKRIEVITEESGKTVSKVKYAGGINTGFKFTWNNRENLNYEYSRTKS